MAAEAILTEIKSRLQARHGRRLRGVIVYGSEARNEARPESDIDVLVLLDEPIDYGRDLEANIEAVHALAMQIGRRISVKPVSFKEYESAECPLYLSARLEGIAV